MARVLTEEIIGISQPSTVQGSSGSVVQGCGITKATRGGIPEEWIPRNTTLIVGFHPKGEEHETETTHVEWQIELKRDFVRKARLALLVFRCDRRLGGLHTPRKGAEARILVNDNVVDIIGLKVKPPGHDDFFHPVLEREIPDVPEFNKNDTIYSFHVPAEYLDGDGSQKVGVILDAGVRWDVDYVDLLVRYRRVKLRSWLMWVLALISGAIAGQIAAVIWEMF